MGAEPEPRVPPGLDPGGIAVAHIDTGVNYTLPVISKRLARDGEGDIIGYDFEDDDLTPFDAAPGRRSGSSVGNIPSADGPSRIRRHGTSVAAIILREAPTARLQPYRFAVQRPESFAEAIAQIAYTEARIVAMPLGGYRREEWEPFRAAAAANPQLLFIVSAGNEGRDLAERPIYPPAFQLANVLVVAGTDPFGRFPRASNTGASIIDIATPSERIKSIGFDGARTAVSGSSFAVPRIAALAARMLKQSPDLETTALKQKIIALAGPNPSHRAPMTKHGWIAAPDQLLPPG
ncbi:MAG: S8 family serine peptidase [Pseudomonadota bacterium]